MSDVAQDTTSLAGSVPDQAALHGILAQIRDLGLTLVPLTRLEMDTYGLRITSSPARRSSCEKTFTLLKRRRRAIISETHSIREGFA